MENQALSGNVRVILRSRLILENIQRKFFVILRGHYPGSPDRAKPFCEVFENQTRSQNSAYTTGKNLA